MEVKVKVIKLNEKGESFRKLAVMFDVGKTQINNIIKDKENIRQNLNLYSFSV
jgi:transcriptional regulator